MLKRLMHKKMPQIDRELSKYFFRRFWCSFCEFSERFRSKFQTNQLNNKKRAKQ